ncbi:9957_t:CDS:1, partial [Ambispora leptoticha]
KNTTGETNETNADTGEIDVKTATSNNLDLVTEDNVTNDITETNVPNSDDAVLDAMIDAIVDVNNVNTKHSESSADLEKLLPNDSPNDSSNDSSNNSQNDSNNLSNDSSHDSSNQLPNTLSNSNYTSGTVTSTNEKPLSLATSSTAQLHHPPSSPTADSTLDNSSQPNVPLESDSTSFPHSHVARSIPPTPTTPYFPATEGSTNLPEFPSEPISGMPYQSRLCMLYPFTLYDALQHATFNTSLYASSRRAMQILQASRTYFAHELLGRLQTMENFSDVNEQNIEDFFFEPDELPKVPEETKKIKQCLDIVRDEISTLRQQWNSASWVMTAIEWDRQRTMKSYNFGSRSLSHNFSRKSLLSNRSTSIRSSNRESDNSSMVKGKGSDTASQIETLRDTMYHAPDRAWNNIRLLGVNLPTSDINDFVFVKNKQSNSKQKKQPNKKTSKSQKMAASKPIPPILASYLSTLPSVSSKNRSSTSSS